MSPPPDLATASDRDVVRSARKGREEAYRELVRRYRRRVLAAVFRIVGHRERAKDLTQETFVKAFGALDRYRSERKLAPWMLTIANNTAREYLRVHRRRVDSPSAAHALTPGHIDVPAVWPADPADAPAPEPGGEESALALEEALKRLRPEYRQCVLLRHIEGRSYEEIAAIMHLPVGTVGTYLHRARKELRRMVGSADDASRADRGRTPATS